MAKSMITTKDRTFAIFSDDAFPEFLEGITERIETLAVSKGVVWMDELTDYTSELVGMGPQTLMIENAILSTMKSLWDTDKLNPEITTKWDGLFYSWARHVSQRGVEIPSESTLQNRISVYNFYFKNRNMAGGFCLPPQLVYELEMELEDGTFVFEEITVDNPNLMQAAFSKLLAAKGFAIKNGGNLSDKLIAGMINNEVTFKEFSSQLAIEKAEAKGLDDTSKDTDTPTQYQGEDSSKDDPFTEADDKYAGIKEEEGDGLVTNGETIQTDYTVLEAPDDQGVYYQEGAIMYTQDGITVPVFIRATPQDGADHPLVEIGQNYVLGRFGIHDPDLITGVIQTEAPAFVYTEDQKGIITINGYQFAEVDKNTVIVLHQCISEAMEKILGGDGEAKEKEENVLSEETEG